MLYFHKLTINYRLIGFYFRLTTYALITSNKTSFSCYPVWFYRNAFRKVWTRIKTHLPKKNYH
jgi:hypothetical protein